MKNKLKTGDYIHWVADRMFKAWDVYGKILSEQGGDFNIITFDDFKETKIAIGGEAAAKEITICDKSDVELYFKKQKLHCNNRIAEAELEFETKKIGFNKVISQYETYTL